ncbi:uncharacterized protein LOC132902479 [Amyelois transitella]|uniref:uncharacterized protein LOC132902479 n=1 Tax=Amyelois transitella TaxID=680683 RepID=UPI00299034F5|nr:uncharacterized protein LOC132902479 [Amyelois transitella]
MAYMNVITFTILLLLKSVINCKIPRTNVETINDAVKCTNKIILKHYAEGSELTFLDLSNSGDNDDILMEIHKKFHVTVISRTYKQFYTYPNEGYVIYAKAANDFVNFKYLTKEAPWNPHAKFIAVVESKDDEMRYIFDTFLKYHVFNVVLIKGLQDSELYTYNPFENYGCGKRFHRIIDYGKCKDTFETNLFPNKLVTGLQNCIFNIAAPHWPPYSIDPNFNTTRSLGIEQHIFKVISEIEHFTINYTYNNDAEKFTVINDEMTAIGPMELLQKNEADVIIGGMMLINDRAAAFDYMYTHLANVDEIKIMVKKAEIVRNWKNIYIEFQPTVWILLIVSFVIYCLFLILIIRGRDNISIILKMWDSLFLHVRPIGNNCVVKCAFITWIWFAYMINSYYQSTLVSLNTHPATEYQISNEQDLEDYHMRPCVSIAIQTLMWAELGMPMQNVTKDCEPFLESLKTVTKRDDLYTIILYSIYSYHKFKFVDDYGHLLLYEFPSLNKVMYAMYFYKGFPLKGIFQNHGLRLRENGLIQKISQDLYYEGSIKHYYAKKRMEFKIIVPWYIYAFGVGLASLIFTIEMMLKFVKSASLSV